MPSSCLFCRLAAGEIPSRKVYEDEETLAFLDAFPTNPGHVLVIPKAHVPTIVDADERTLSAWIASVKRVAAAVQKATGAPGVNLLQNNGEAAGQVIPHLHMHVIPRFADDGLKHWPGQALQDEDGDALRDKIKKSF